MDQQLTSSAPARGMRDLLPQEVALRDWAISQIVSVYSRFGFTRIEAPIMENIGLLKRGEGGENLQLIFEVLKRGDKLDKVLSSSSGASGSVNKAELSDLGLRFDLTVPLVRFYAANQGQLPNPFKAIHIGPVFRAESPQQGRYRQFTQCDIDVIGTKSEIAEMELLQATAEALLALKFENFSIRINDRRILTGLATHCGFEDGRHDTVFIALDKLDKIGLDGVRKELSGNGHSQDAIDRLTTVLKIVSESASAANQDNGLQTTLAPISSAVDAEVLTALSNIISAVSTQGKGKYNVTFDPTLVRGMGYYTGPIFEISMPGYSSSVAGGGRYDKMVGKFSGRDVPACGFSIGFERIISILMERGTTPSDSLEKIAVIFDPDRDDPKVVLAAATKLRSQDKSVTIYTRKKDMRKQLDSLAAQGFNAFAPFKGDADNLEIKSLK